MTAALDDRRQARLGLLQICLAGVLWGTGGLGMQVIREHAPMSVLTVSAWRMLIAAVVLLAAVLLLRQAPSVVALARDPSAARGARGRRARRATRRSTSGPWSPPGSPSRPW